MQAVSSSSAKEASVEPTTTLAEITTATLQQTLQVLVDQILSFDVVSMQETYSRGFVNVTTRRKDCSIAGGNTVVGWGEFLDVWEYQEANRQTEMASMKWEHWDCCLLHIVCACSAPRDVVQRLIQCSPPHVLLHPSGLQLQATPLHLACFFHCSFEAVIALVDAERKTLYRKDAQGRLALHIACGRGTTLASADIVRYLLQSDPELTSLDTRDVYGSTPVQLASQFARKEVVEAVLSAFLDARRDIHSVAQIREQLPLHRALQRCSSDVPIGLVRALSIGSLSQPTEPDVLTTRDRQGQVPLHVAFHHGATAETFQALLDHDSIGKTFNICDDCQQTPLDVLLQQILRNERRSLRTLLQLAEADPSRRVFGTVDPLGLTMLDKLVKFLFLEKNGHPSSHQVKALLSLLCCTPPGSGQYAFSVGSCRRVLDFAFFDQLYHDPRFHRTLNNLMCKRNFTFFFMVDLYVRIVLVTFYTFCSNAAVKGQILNPGYFTVVYLCSLYLMVWQLRLVWYHQLYYLGEFWNILDLLTNLLVLLSLALLQAGSSNQGATRVLNVLVGGLVWFVVVAAALRSTFKPFSVFLSGFTMILSYMIPFGTSLFLLLGSFADMYFKSTVGRTSCSMSEDPSEFCQYGSSFLKVYAMFVSGVDVSLLTTGTDENLLILTVFYGFLFAIVLLNVLVAVVFDAWGRVSPYGERIFYEYRFMFLTETAEKSRRNVFGNFSSLESFHWMDRFSDQVLKNFRGRPTDFGDAVKPEAKVLVVAKYLGEGIMLLLLFILGIFSAGVMWPTTFRRFIFSIGTEEVLDHSATLANGSIRHEGDPNSDPFESDLPSAVGEEDLIRLRGEMRDISRRTQQIEAGIRQLLDKMQ